MFNNNNTTNTTNNTNNTNNNNNNNNNFAHHSGVKTVHPILELRLCI